MKFEKFVKSLASTGTIYERKNGDRWLASPSVFMLIPPTTRSVTAVGIYEMPEAIDKMIDQLGHKTDALLVEAIMPVADGGIKDCVRVFKTMDGTISCAVANDDWSLIEKSDMTEILHQYNIDTGKQEAKALLVNTYPLVPDDENELVGIIFPENYVYGGNNNG